MKRNRASLDNALSCGSVSEWLMELFFLSFFLSLTLYGSEMALFTLDLGSQ